MIHSEEYDSRIIAGAAELFSTYGIKAVTMDEIASHLGISKRTIYERFGDKDEMVFAVLNSMIIKEREKIEDVLKSSPNVIAAIFAMLLTGRDHAASMNPLIIFDLHKYHSKVLMRIKEKCEDPNYEGARKIISKGKEEGLFRKDIDENIVSMFFPEMRSFIADSKVFPAEDFLKRDLIKNVIINYLRGISTSDGIRLINEMESTLNT